MDLFFCHSTVNCLHLHFTMLLSVFGNGNKSMGIRWDCLYGGCEHPFASELNNEHVTIDRCFKAVFEWLSLTWQFASITS